jgi:hypothetical protein
MIVLQTWKVDQSSRSPSDVSLLHDDPRSSLPLSDLQLLDTLYPKSSPIFLQTSPCRTPSLCSYTLHILARDLFCRVFLFPLFHRNNKRDILVQHIFSIVLNNIYRHTFHLQSQRITSSYHTDASYDTVISPISTSRLIWGLAC